MKTTFRARETPSPTPPGGRAALPPTRGLVTARTLAVLSLAAAMCVSGCHRDADDAPDDAAPAASAAATVQAPAEPKAIAEAAVPNAPLKVQVLSAQHVTADTVKVEIALLDLAKPPAPEPAPSSTDSTAAQPVPERLDLGRALRGDAVDRPRPFTTADLCLLTADSSRRLFVLRDPADKPVADANFDPLQPGERRVVWVMFPSPAPSAPGAAPHVTVQIGNVILRDVPVAPLPPANPS